MDEQDFQAMMEGYDENWSAISVEINDDFSLINEADAPLLDRIWAGWYASPLGKEFAEKYKSKENLTKLLKGVVAVGYYLSVDALNRAYSILVQNNRFEPVASDREVEESNRQKWQRQCLEFYNSSSTAEVKKRFETDPLFRNFINGNPTLVYTDYEEIPKPKIFDYKSNSFVEAPAGLHPDMYQKQQQELRQQKKQDAKYLETPQELRDWAAAYHKMTALQVKTAMTNPEFRQNMEEAAKHKLI